MNIASRRHAIVLGCLLYMQATAAHGQMYREREVREPLQLAGSGSSGAGFTLTFTLPLFYSTSVIAANADGGAGDKPDWHAYPDVTLKWSRQLDWFRLTAYGAMAFDRFREFADNDINLVEGGVTVDITDGRSDRFVPYLSYIYRTYLEPDFGDLGDRRHDLAIGFYSGIGQRDGRFIPYANATRAGDVSFRIDIQGGTRIASETQREHDFLTAAFEYTYTFRRDFWFVLGPKARVRWYDDYFGDFRRDVRVGAIAKLVWEPEWLSRVLPNTQIILSAEYLRNYSTEPTSEYKLWELGPTLKMSTKF